MKKISKQHKNNIDSKEINYYHHKISFEEIKNSFNTSLESGLEELYAQQLLVKNGRNQIKSPHKNVIFKILGYFFTGFKHFFCGDKRVSTNKFNIFIENKVFVASYGYHH